MGEGYKQSMFSKNANLKTILGAMALSFMVMACSEGKVDTKDLKFGECENEYFGYYVGPPCAIPSAVFQSLFVPETENKMMGVQLWFLEEGLVVNDDVGSDLEFCSDERFTFCIIMPEPFFLPKDVSRAHSFEIDGEEYLINVQNRSFGNTSLKALCDYQSIVVEVVDTKSRSYRYTVFKDHGLKRYVVRSPDGIYDNELVNIRGQIFEYGSLCG